MSINLKLVIVSLIVLVIALGFLVPFPNSAQAEDGGDTGPTDGGDTGPTDGGSGNQSIDLVNQLSFGSIEEFLDRVADILFTYSIPLVVIMIIIGAFYLVTAGGNPGKIDTGKKIITWAIIGFVVILIAGSIASLVRNLLEG